MSSKLAFRALAGLVLAAAPALALQEPMPVQEREGPALQAGDVAPPLMVETWVKGDPVESFQQGKVYVVEFWATWCGPCIQTMPHLSELQKQYREKGLTIIGMTSEDPNNSLEQVREMVEQKGDVMGYTVAWDKQGQTNQAYMKAAEQRGIPTSFVVNQEGDVAYIGHPMWLDLVLDKVMAGTWDPAKGGEVIAKAEQQMNAIFETAEGDPDAAIGLLEEFSKQHPGVAKMFRTLHFSLLLDAGRLDEGYEMARKIVAEATAAKDANTLMGVAMRIVDPEQELERRDLDLALKAAKAAVEITADENPFALMILARAHSQKGEHEAALAAMEKSVALAAEEPRMQQYLQGILDELKAAAGQ